MLMSSAPCFPSVVKGASVYRNDTKSLCWMCCGILLLFLSHRAQRIGNFPFCDLTNSITLTCELYMTLNCCDRIRIELACCVTYFLLFCFLQSEFHVTKGMCDVYLQIALIEYDNRLAHSKQCHRMTLVLIIRSVLRYLFRNLTALCKYAPDIWWEMERQETRLYFPTGSFGWCMFVSFFKLICVLLI